MIGVLVSGTGTNLQALLDAGLPVVAVASNRADAPALTRAGDVPHAAFELADFSSRSERDAAMAQWLHGNGVRLVVLAGYMHLLTPAFLDRFPNAVVNVHPSLLPQFPGAHAVEEQLAAGVSESGATVHLVDEASTPAPCSHRSASVPPDDTPGRCTSASRRSSIVYCPESWRNCARADLDVRQDRPRHSAAVSPTSAGSSSRAAAPPPSSRTRSASPSSAWRPDRLARDARRPGEDAAPEHPRCNPARRVATTTWRRSRSTTSSRSTSCA